MILTITFIFCVIGYLACGYLLKGYEDDKLL